MTDEKAIKDLLEHEYSARLNGADIDAYVELYDDDVVWGVPNLPDAKSRHEIGSLLGKILSKVSQTVEVTVDDLLIDGDHAMAVATGTAARLPDGDPQPLALRVMWALRRVDGQWKIIRQVGTPKPTS